MMDKWLIWVDYNDEQDKLEKMFGDMCVSIRGSTTDQEKIRMEQAWRKGDVPVMITKSRIFGWGMNWVHCHNMVFVGLSDSFESQFQSIRRCYRFGQTEPVNVYMVTSDLEGAVAANVKRKEADFERMQEEMSKYTREFVLENVRSSISNKTDYVNNTIMTLPRWLRSV